MERTRAAELLHSFLSLVIVWYTLHGYHPDDLARRRSDQPWYPYKDEPAFEDMLYKLRRTLVAARITSVAVAQLTPANTKTTNWPAPLPPHNCDTQVMCAGKNGFAQSVYLSMSVKPLFRVIYLLDQSMSGKGFQTGRREHGTGLRPPCRLEAVDLAGKGCAD